MLQYMLKDKCVAIIYDSEVLWFFKHSFHNQDEAIQ